MYSEVTAVYVPVKTPDYKLWAILLSVIVHIGLIGSLLFFNHTASPPPMETTLVTPEELSQIEGQIRANQLNNAPQAGTAPSMSDMLSNIAKPSQRDPQTEQVMQDIVARETAWRKEQERIAKQLDQEVAQEQQQVIDELNAKQAEEQAALEHNRTAEDSLEDIQKRLNEEAKAYAKDALPPSPTENKTAPTGEPISIKASSGVAKSAVVGGNNTNSSSSDTGQAKADYKNLIFSRIKSNWQPPNNSNSELTANFNISPTGAITITGISGGSSASQASLREAINRSNPLPPPPANVYNAFQSNRLIFREK